MKKLLVFTLLVIMLLAVLVPSVNAATTSELVDKLYSVASKYGATAADKVRLERYFADYPVTEAQADELIAKVNEADSIAKGVSDSSKLTAAQKTQLTQIANDAGSILNVTLVFKNGSIEIYKNGALFDTVSFNSGKLQQTGVNISTGVYVSGAILAVVVIAGVVLVVKKRKNNV